jgi:hypothetical protein
VFGSMRIKIDRDLHARAKAAAARAGYSSVDEFIRHTLEERVRSIEDGDSDDLKNRLRGLGYLG